MSENPIIDVLEYLRETVRAQGNYLTDIYQWKGYPALQVRSGQTRQMLTWTPLVEQTRTVEIAIPDAMPLEIVLENMPTGRRTRSWVIEQLQNTIREMAEETRQRLLPPRQVWVRWKGWIYWKYGGDQSKPTYDWEREFDVFWWTPEDEAPTMEQMLQMTYAVLQLSGTMRGGRYRGGFNWEHTRKRMVDGDFVTRVDLYGNISRRFEHAYHDIQDGAGDEPEWSMLQGSCGSSDHPCYYWEQNPQHRMAMAAGETGLRLLVPTSEHDPEYDPEIERELNELTTSLEWEMWKRHKGPTVLHAEGTANLSLVQRFIRNNPEKVML